MLIIAVIPKRLPVETAQIYRWATNFKRVRRGRLTAIVELEGREPSLGDDNHSTLLDVHLRRPGSTSDLLDTNFRTFNDDLTSTTDTDATLAEVSPGKVGVFKNTPRNSSSFVKPSPSEST